MEADGRHTAIRLLHRLLPALDAPIPGLRNGGLFAMQELERGVPSRGDWTIAVEEARGVRTLRGRALIQGLGFATEELPGPAMLLVAGDRKTAVAVLLDRPEEIDSASARFDGVSPVSYALAQADRENLDWVVAVAGGALRLYPAKPGIGTGRRGRSETFVEIDLDLLAGDNAGYLWLLLSAPALSESLVASLPCWRGQRTHHQPQKPTVRESGATPDRLRAWGPACPREANLWA